MEEKLKILFNEDVKTDAELIWRELKKSKLVFDKLLVDNKKDFLNGLKSFSPDIIISDYSLPQFNGMQALLLRNEYSPGIPFIIVTGSINENVAVDCMKAGADDYILKDNLSRLGLSVKSALTKAKLIKERNIAEGALRESEERYRLIVDKSPNTIAIHHEGKLVFMNPAGAKLLGSEKPENLIGTPILNFVHPDYRNDVIKRMRLVSEGKEAPLFEEKFVKLDGSELDVEVVGIPINFLGHEATQVIVTDITQRKLAEEAVKQSELRFKQISENFGEWIWEVDKTGLYTYSSPVVKEILGYEPEELVNKVHFYDLFTDNDRRQFKHLALDAFERKENFRNFINTNHHKNGKEVILSTSGFPLLDGAGNLTGYRGVDTDITERKLSEVALIESEMKYRQLVTRSPDGIFVVDLAGRFLSVNSSICNNLKYSEEELLSMRIWDIVPLKYQTFQKQRMMAIINGESPNSAAEYEVIDKNGISYPVEVLSAPYYRGKEIIGFQGIARDIRERQQTEKVLRESEEKYRSIFENIQDLYYESTLDGILIEVSPSISTLSRGQYRREDLIGKSMYDFYSYPGEHDLLMASLSTKGKISDFEIGLKNRDGSLIPCSVSANIYSDSQGNPQKIIGSMRDISERKRAEEALQQNLNFSESLLKTIPFGMDIVDEMGTVLFHSENFKELFGEEAIGEKCWNLYRDDKAQCIDCPLHKGITVGETEAYESHGVMGGRVFEINHTGIMYQGKRAMLEIFQDITERKTNEEELISAKVKAEESDRLKTAFLHNISHEIRTPMNAIVGFSALLGEPDIDFLTRQAYIEMIVQGSNHLLSIISDIVDISNIEANLVKIAKNDINLNVFLNSIYNQFLPKANERNIKFTFKNELSDVDALIISDSTKLNQILSNLLNNAFKFTDHGSIEVECKKMDSFLQFCVSDTGIGIPAEFHGKVFDRFYQVEHSKAKLYEGTGLGLAISSGYVELLGGRIWVSSERGKGSSFYFTLPYQKQDLKIKTVIEKPVLHEFVFKKKMRILVAEDVESNFKLLNYFLSGTNTETIRARNGKEAVDICLSDRSIDLILMDIKMPEMDGYTAAKLIREANISIPIIAQTAYAEDKDKAIESGCSDFLAKPFDRKRLLNKISEHI